MNWTNKRVLVTGAGGFIGSHLTERLVRAGATVRAFTHYNGMGHRGWLEHSEYNTDIDFVAGDIVDAQMVRNAVRDTDIIFHLAALIAIPYSYSAPSSYLQVNATGTLNVLHAAREFDVERMVHTSTSEVYGSARQVPIGEGHSLHGQSPYAASKIAADKMAEAFYCSYELPVTTVRPFNTFGPRQSARAVIPAIISQCLAGDVVKLGSLTPRRDMNYVENTVDGFLAAAHSPDAIGETINVGSGLDISIGDLAALIVGFFDRSIDIVSDESRIRPEKSEVNRLQADNRRAKQLLGWSPNVSLEDGLQRTVSWLSDNLHQYRTNSYAI